MKSILFFLSEAWSKVFRKAEQEDSLDHLLFLTLMSCIPGQSWYTTASQKTEVFLVGVNLPNGTVTMFLPVSLLNTASETGANLLPLPFCSGQPTLSQTKAKLKQFASR